MWATQNPANKAEIVADDALAALTGEHRFKGFGHMKLFSRHILGPAEARGVMAAGAKAEGVKAEGEC